jgi:hypothetical protein
VDLISKKNVILTLSTSCGRGWACFCGWKNRRAEMQPNSMVCKVISLQCRGGTQRELFVDSLFGVLMLSVWFYFLGNR